MTTVTHNPLPGTRQNGMLIDSFGLPVLPTGYRRPGSIPIGWDKDMLLPDWIGGAGTQFNPSQVQFQPGGSARLVYEGKHLSGEMQLRKPWRSTGRWGAIARSHRPEAVCAIFCYARCGTEIDWEYRGDEMWQLNLHLNGRTPKVLPTVYMPRAKIAEWNRYEFALTASACIWYLNGREVARVRLADMQPGAVWKTDARMELFTSVEHHGAWAKHSYTNMPATFEIAGLLV